MKSSDFNFEEQVSRLKEREKEMKCLYRVQEIVSNNLPVEEFLMEVVKHIWGGWQYPNITRAKITFEDKIFKEPGWEETEWIQASNIIIDDEVLGKIEVYYTQFKQMVTDSQFLPEEQKLLNAIAAQIGNYIFHKRLKKTLEVLDSVKDQKVKKQENSFSLLGTQSDVHWKWRNNIVNTLTEKIELERFGTKALYLIGSTKNATAGPASDIDLIVHFTGTQNQKKEMEAWFQGWSYCLSEMNLLKTGYKTDGLIDLHMVTDEDIWNKTSFAIKIGAISDGARLLKKK